MRLFYNAFDTKVLEDYLYFCLTDFYNIQKKNATKISPQDRRTQC